MSSDFSVKILGCRGSIPVGGAGIERHGGATSCVVVRAGGREIVLDAGSGITEFGAQLSARKESPHVYLFLTHVHFDHVIGLPYFSAMYRPDATVEIWGPRNMRFGGIGETLDYLIQPPFHPVPFYEMLARKKFYDIGEADVVYFVKGQRDPIMASPCHPDDRDKIPAKEDIDVEIHCMRGYNHPKSGVNLYKVIAGDKSMVYATDTEGYVNGDRRLIKFAAGSDLLIHDAMYTEERYVSMPVPTQGYGHSTVEIACSLANTAKVGKLALFHHDPSSTDEYLDEVEKHAQSLFAGSIMAKDGLNISL